MQGITIDRQGAFHNRSNGQYAAKPGASSHTDLDWNTNQTQAWANATKTFAKTVNSPEAEEVFDKVRIVKGVGIAVVAAGLVSACGGGSTEAYTPSYPDQDSYNQEADSDTSYDNDYDYTDYDYADAAPVLEVGSVLSPEEAESTRAYLRAMDNETRAGRVVINRNGEYVILDVADLQPGDTIGENREDRMFIRATGTPVFHIQGEEPFVFDARNPGSRVTQAIFNVAVNHGGTTRAEAEAALTEGRQGWFSENNIEENLQEIRDANMATFENASFGLVAPFRSFHAQNAGGGEWWGLTGVGGTFDLRDEWNDATTSSNNSPGTRAYVEAHLRRVARNHPNIVVIGFDGEQIRG